MENDELQMVTHTVASHLRDRELRLATAESCTGGWIAKICTDLAGSSDWFECGFVTYSNQTKQDMLEVSDETLTLFGAVSEPVAGEMARGAVANSQAEVSIAVTGIAGPGGGTETKPVGLVCFGWIVPGKEDRTETRYFDGDRDSVRRQTVEYALRRLIMLLN